LKVLLIRHAESYGNATGEYGTAQSDSLSEKGLEQAGSLSMSSIISSCDRIAVSPLLRTLQTISPFLQKNSRVGEVWPEMAEACWHDEREEPTETWAFRDARIPESMLPYFNFRNGEARQPDHPETFGMGLQRVRLVLLRLEIEEIKKEGKILLVTHGHFIRELLNLMLKPEAFQEYHQENCAITQLSYVEGVWELEGVTSQEEAQE